MSADNWAQCPRCTARAAAEFRARSVAIHASYGKVPVDEFDEARRQLAADEAAFAGKAHTFREDYEFFGAETGTVTASYVGHCAKCNLTLKFEDNHPIPGWES